MFIYLFVYLFIYSFVCLFTEEPCGGKPSDVVFILDASNSIWEPDFRRQLFFVSEVIRMFTLGKEAMHVGVSTFNDVTQLWFGLNTYTDKTDILEAVAHIFQGINCSIVFILIVLWENHNLLPQNQSLSH